MDSIYNAVNNSNLHYELIKAIISNGYAPTTMELAATFRVREEEIIEALYKLQDYHGVVLHPHQPKVWAIHPFSLSPTNFYVKSRTGEWWGNCAWCSLGIAALVKEDVEIITTIGAESKQVIIRIVDGQIQDKGYFIHFPVPMKNAWDNVIYSCSNMLVFESEKQIDNWSKKHGIDKGDIQPIGKIWKFSKDWYGNHLNPDWTKWTIDEAKQLFRKFELGGKIWQLDPSNGRF